MQKRDKITSIKDSNPEYFKAQSDRKHKDNNMSKAAERGRAEDKHFVHAAKMRPSHEHKDKKR